MKTSHTHKNPIGFKVTDNKLMVIEENSPNKDINPLTPQEEAIFKIASAIHELMKKRSGMFINDEPFFDIEGKKIIPLLNKVYVRYYENF